jgi:hypothetical protein
LLVCPSESQVLIEDLNNEINGFDGERILLKSPNGKEGCWLQ